MVTNNAINANDTGLVTYDGIGNFSAVSSVTAGQVLQATATASTPAYSTATYPSTAGTAGNLMTSNGTNFVSSTNTSVGSSLFLISDQTASSSSTIDFIAFGASTYRKFLLLFRGIRPDTDGANFIMQGSINSGSSWVTSTYQAGCTYSDYNSTTLANTNSTANWVLSGPLDNGSSSRHASGLVEIWTISAGVTRITGNVSFYNDTTGVESYGSIGGLMSTNSLNSVRCLMSTGNFSGSLQLYGILS